MSISYYLVCNLPNGSQRLTELIRQTVQTKQLAAHVIAGDLLIRVSEVSGSDENLAAEILGAGPKTDVLFRLQPRGNPIDQAFRDMVRCVAAILAGTAQDCVLLYNFDTVRLERIDGRVRVDASEVVGNDMWTAELIRQGLAFEVTSLEQPLL